VRRGELWLAQVGHRNRPVLVLTRSEVIDVRALVTVAEVSTSIRGLAAEVSIEAGAGLARPSVVNCDGIHTMTRSALTTHVGTLDDDTLSDVCRAVSYAIGC